MKNKNPQALENLPAAVVRYPWILFAVIAVITSFMAYGLFKHFTFDVSISSWFEKDAEPITLRNEFKGIFGSDEHVYIIYRPSSGDVFSEDALRLVKKLHEAIESAADESGKSDSPLSHIKKVESLYNARYQVADGDTLITRKLIGANFPSNAKDRDKLRAIAVSQDAFERVYFSKNFQYGGIQIKTDFGEPVRKDAVLETFALGGNLLEDDFAAINSNQVTDTNASANAVDTEPEFIPTDIIENQAFMNALREITGREEFKDFEFHYIGPPVSNDFIMHSTVVAGGLILLMAMTLIGMLWFLFRSFSAVVWPFTIVTLVLIWTAGLGSWMGVTFTTMLMMTAMLILSITVATFVHITNSYLLQKAQGIETGEAITRAYKKTRSAVILTSITTIVGMLSLGLSDMPAIQTFGFTSAASIGFILFLTIFLLPSMLSKWHPPVKALSPESTRKSSSALGLARFLDWVNFITRRYSKPIVVFYGFLFLFLLAGAFNIKFDSNQSELSTENSPFTQAIRLVDREMMGAMSLELFVEFESRDALKDPLVLRTIADFQDHMEQTYGDKVIKSFSLADIVKDTNQVMNGDQPEFHRIPDDPRLVAQLLYLFNNSSSEDRRDVVTDDYRKTHISVLLKNAGTYEYVPMLAQLEKDLKTYFGPLDGKYGKANARPTGTFNLMMALNDDVAITMLKSFSTALLLITLILMFSLGSFQSGVIASIPNLLPAVFTFGFMGWFGISMDMNALIVAPAIIGIAVDDTIHFLSHYRKTWLDTGDVDIAVSKTLFEVGSAVIFTSLILGLGFGALAFSDFQGTARPGYIGAMSIFVALMSDLFFLPALLYWLKPNMGRDKVLKQSALLQSN